MNCHVNFMLNQALTKDAGLAKMWEKVKGTNSLKCRVLSVSVLSHASMTLNFKYGKFFHVHNGLK